MENLINFLMELKKENVFVQEKVLNKIDLPLLNDYKCYYKTLDKANNKAKKLVFVFEKRQMTKEKKQAIEKIENSIKFIESIYYFQDGDSDVLKYMKKTLKTK